MQTLLHLTEFKEYIEYGDATSGLRPGLLVLREKLFKKVKC
jgi:hypothetical protein